MIECNLVTAVPALDVDMNEQGLAALVAAVLVEAGIDHEQDEVTVDVRLIDESESADLNGRYRDKHYATNVLSFPAELHLPGLRALGDLAVCMPVVRREAREQGKSLTAHLSHMIVHGIFHLLGYDHMREDQAETMETAEQRVMARLGYADPYATDQARL